MENRAVDRIVLLNMTIVVEALLLLSATFWSHVAGVRLLKALHLDAHHLLLGAACGAALAFLSFSLLWLGQRFNLFVTLREITFDLIAPIFSELHAIDLVAVAVISGFCEEILFRGVMQDQFNIWITSAIFGLFHCPSLKFMSYGLWVFAAGLFLGWIYILTGNLWCPIAAHAVSNCIALLFLRYSVKPAKPDAD